MIQTVQIKVIKAFYNKAVKGGMHPLDALNTIMKVFYGITFKGRLEKLFTVENVKTVKGQKKGFLTGIIYLAPSNMSGVNVCAMAEKAGCKNPCLFTSGKGRYSNVQLSRLRKTLYYLLNPVGFYAMADKDMARLKRKAAKLDFTLALRFNGTSDVAWYKTPMFEQAIKHDAIVYDYTKVVRHITEAPKGYHYTLSYSESTPYYANMVKDAMVQYPTLNVAVVFRNGLPETFLGRKVIDGDETDLRFLDETGVVVGLSAKGRAKKDKSGFVID